MRLKELPIGTKIAFLHRDGSNYVELKEGLTGITPKGNDIFLGDTEYTNVEGYKYLHRIITTKEALIKDLTHKNYYEKN